MRRLHATLILAIAAPAAAQGDDIAARGAALYADNCLECHGPTATEGEVGDIRGLSLGTVTGAVRSGPGMMPVFALGEDEIRAIVAYLGRLRSG
jgi:mono/diheme cytochrome c family protein